ncbi:hypothetical protein Tco_0646205 [Tanacetum coccineum]
MTEQTDPTLQKIVILRLSAALHSSQVPKGFDSRLQLNVHELDFGVVAQIAGETLSSVPPCGWKHSVEVLDDSLREQHGWKYSTCAYRLELLLVIGGLVRDSLGWRFAFFGKATLMLPFAILGFTVKSKTKKEYMVNGFASKKGRRMKGGGPYESDKPKNTRNIIIAVQFVRGEHVNTQVCWHCHKQVVFNPTLVPSTELLFSTKHMQDEGNKSITKSTRNSFHKLQSSHVGVSGGRMRREDVQRTPVTNSVYIKVGMYVAGVRMNWSK